MKKEFTRYLWSLTKKEKEGCIKDMEECLENLKQGNDSVLHQEVSDVDRETLTKYNLFEKKNYFTYKMSKHIVDIILTLDDFILYGGYLRDNILHDNMASTFHTKECFPFFLSPVDIFDLYNDPKVDSNTSMRTLVPKDIDVVFHTFESYVEFERKLKSKGYHYFVKLAEDHGKYFIDDNDKHLQKDRRKLLVSSNIGIRDLHRYDTKLISKEYITTTIVIDVTICKDYVPSSDFLCNSLQLTSRGFIFKDHISNVERGFYYQNVSGVIKEHENDTNLLTEIHDQIVKMEAVIQRRDYACPRIDKHRMIKMIVKGWKLIFKNLTGCLSQIVQEDDIDMCMICRDEFHVVNDVPGFQLLHDGVKFSCCQCGYHPKCLAKLFEKPSSNLIYGHQKYVYKCIQCSRISIHIGDHNDLLSYLINMDYAFREIFE